MWLLLCLIGAKEAFQEVKEYKQGQDQELQEANQEVPGLVYTEDYNKFICLHQQQHP